MCPKAGYGRRADLTKNDTQLEDSRNRSLIMKASREPHGLMVAMLKPWNLEERCKTVSLGAGWAKKVQA